MWNGVPAPGCVQFSDDRNAVVVEGSNAASHSNVAPLCNAVNSHVKPPIWGNGNTNAGLSPSWTSKRSPILSPIAAIDASVCFAPLGSAVVPDV